MEKRKKVNISKENLKKVKPKQRKWIQKIIALITGGAMITSVGYKVIKDILNQKIDDELTLEQVIEMYSDYTLFDEVIDYQEESLPANLGTGNEVLESIEDLEYYLSASGKLAALGLDDYVKDVLDITEIKLDSIDDYTRDDFERDYEEFISEKQNYKKLKDLGSDKDISFYRLTMRLREYAKSVNNWLLNFGYHQASELGILAVKLELMDVLRIEDINQIENIVIPSDSDYSKEDGGKFHIIITIDGAAYDYSIGYGNSLYYLTKCIYECQYQNNKEESQGVGYTGYNQNRNNNIINLLRNLKKVVADLYVTKGGDYKLESAKQGFGLRLEREMKKKFNL